LAEVIFRMAERGQVEDVQDVREDEELVRRLCRALDKFRDMHTNERNAQRRGWMKDDPYAGSAVLLGLLLFFSRLYSGESLDLKLQTRQDRPKKPPSFLDFALSLNLRGLILVLEFAACESLWA
jgi:hypothetical protein